MTRARWGVVIAVLLLSRPAWGMQGGQGGRRAVPSAAELAVSRGQLAEAESVLYEASRRAPRDPAARGALGGFLAARGQLKVGQVLLEEAKLFGGDARAIDERLGHIYGWTGVWATPSSAGRGDAFWERAAYLAKIPSAAPTGPDSSEVALEPNESAGFGRVVLDVGGVMVPADVDARAEGIVLPAALRSLGGVELFGTRDGATLAVVHEVMIGAHRLRNVPARIERVASARIGLDVLAKLTPTFDASRKTLTLHSASSAPTPAPGEALPILLMFPGVRMVARSGEPPVAMESPAARAALRGTRWTFDVRRGAVVVAR
jgi:hypothetical protein